MQLKKKNLRIRGAGFRTGAGSGSYLHRHQEDRL